MHSFHGAFQHTLLLLKSEVASGMPVPLTAAAPVYQQFLASLLASCLLFISRVASAGTVALQF